jgi:hypothetical protein
VGRKLRGTFKLAVIGGVATALVAAARKLMGGLGPEPGSPEAPQAWPSLVPDPGSASSTGGDSTSGAGTAPSETTPSGTFPGETAPAGTVPPVEVIETVPVVEIIETEPVVTTPIEHVPPVDLAEPGPQPESGPAPRPATDAAEFTELTPSDAQTD